MKKISLKKAAAVCLATLMAVISVTGCGKSGDSEKEGKTA